MQYFSASINVNLENIAKLCHHTISKICYINLTLMMNLSKYHFVLGNVYLKFFLFKIMHYPVAIYLTEVISRNTRTKYEIYSKLKVCQSNVCEDVVLVVLLLTLSRFHTFFQYFHCFLRTGKLSLSTRCTKEIECVPITTGKG